MLNGLFYAACGMVCYGQCLVLSYHRNAEPCQATSSLVRFVQLFVCKCFRRVSYVFNCVQMITYLWRYALFDSALSLQQDFVWVLQHVSRKSVYFTNEKSKAPLPSSVLFSTNMAGSLVCVVLRFLLGICYASLRLYCTFTKQTLCRSNYYSFNQVVSFSIVLYTLSNEKHDPRFQCLGSRVNTKDVFK